MTTTNVPFQMEIELVFFCRSACQSRHLLQTLTFEAFGACSQPSQTQLLTLYDVMHVLFIRLASDVEHRITVRFYGVESTCPYRFLRSAGGQIVIEVS